MSLVSSTIPNFANGISQQPPTLRLASQGELQENGLSTIAKGLQDRPPTEHRKQVRTTPIDDGFIHVINRDFSERYIVIVTDGMLKVYTIDGEEMTVNAPKGFGYLSSDTPSSSLIAVTVADYTFIVNKRVIVRESAEVAPARPYEALINVKQGNYGKTYNIIIDGVTEASHTTPDGTSASHSTAISTDVIAAGLLSNLGGKLNAKRYGSVIHLSSNKDFTVATEDGFNNNAMVGIKDRLQKFSDLPVRPRVEGFTVEIVGDTGSSFDNYWVKHSLTSSSGVWEETIAPGTPLGVVDSTMPHVLIREADGSFTFKPMAWDKRKVGDIDSSPNPSFIDRTITDVFFHRNRLGFLSDEAVIFSEAGNYFNFFRTTVETVLDADSIDVSASHTQVSILAHAVVYNRKLLLWSEQTQFVIDTNDLLTSKTVSIKPTTFYPCNVLAKPVSAGKNVYFAVDKGEWSAVREYFTDNSTSNDDSLDITSHVPEYIPSGVFKLSVCPQEDLLIALSRKAPNAVYVYNYFWNGEEKLQSAWHKWTWPEGEKVLSAEFIQSDLYLVISRPSGVFFEKMGLSLGNQMEHEPYPVKLDRKVTIEPEQLSYDGEYTTISLDYVPDGGEYQAVVALGQPLKAGTILNIEVKNGVAKVRKNLTGNRLLFGRKFSFRYRLSEITIKAATPTGGTKSDTEGKLMLRRLSVNFADTGYLKLTATPENRETRSKVFSGKILGTPSATIGEVGLSTSRISIPVFSKNVGTIIEIENDSPLPCSILSADWEGFFVKRSNAI